MDCPTTFGRALGPRRISSLGLGVAILLGAVPARAELIAGWDFSDLPASGAPIPSAYPATHLAPGASATLSVPTGGATAIALPPAPGGETDLACGRAGLIGDVDPTFPPGTPTFGGPAFLALTAPSTSPTRIELEADRGVLDAFEWRLTAGALLLQTPGQPAPSLPQFLQVSLGSTCATASPVAFPPVGVGETAIDVRLGSSAPGSACVVIEAQTEGAELVLDNVALNAVGVASDSDADRVPDAEDNCITIPNGPGEGSNQVDSDGDGYGNACDADYEIEIPFDDLATTVTDFSVFLGSFTQADPDEDADHNGDCITTVTDFVTFLRHFQGAPIGPGLPCAGPGVTDCLPDPRMEACVPVPGTFCEDAVPF